MIDLKAEKIEDQGQGSGWRLGSHLLVGYERAGCGQVPAGLMGDFDRDAWGHCGLGRQPLAPLSCQISIISAQDPPYFPGPFSINGQGWLLAPSQGLKGQGQKVSLTWDLSWMGHTMYRATTS